MTEERTRDAVDDLWASTVADPEAGLAALFAADVRRRRHRRAGLAAAGAVAVVAAWWGGSSIGAREQVAPLPGPAVSDPDPTPRQDAPAACQVDGLKCLGQRTYLMYLAVPLRWHIPRGYGVASGGGVSSHLVESFRKPDGQAGVSVLEGVHAASVASTAATGVPATARAFSHWLAARPFLDASTPRRTTVDGREAWTVRATLRPGLPAGPGVCSGYACYPLTFSAGGITGIWGHMVADYTAFDLPGAGTTVVWSWSFDRGVDPLAANRVLVNGLSWPSG